MMGGDPRRWYMGVEWEYWHHKYGVRGVTETHPQIQIKWFF